MHSQSVMQCVMMQVMYAVQDEAALIADLSVSAIAATQPTARESCATLDEAVSTGNISAPLMPQL